MTNKFFALLTLYFTAGFAASASAQSVDPYTLRVGVASAQYFQTFTNQAIDFIQGSNPDFPVFDPSAARGQYPSQGGQLPPCDRGGNWYAVDESQTKFVCIDSNQTYYCPYGTYAIETDVGFYCSLSPAYDNRFLSTDVLEMDNLAVEGLKWFNRSQAHAAFKFSRALEALNMGNFSEADVLKNEGCGQYNESSIALGATTLPANMQPVGFINSALINDMSAALKATAAVVCPK